MLIFLSTTPCPLAFVLYRGLLPVSTLRVVFVSFHPKDCLFSLCGTSYSLIVNLVFALKTSKQAIRQQVEGRICRRQLRHPDTNSGHSTARRGRHKFSQLIITMTREPGGKFSFFNPAIKNIISANMQGLHFQFLA